MVNKALLSAALFAGLGVAKTIEVTVGPGETYSPNSIQADANDTQVHRVHATNNPS